jgi:galactokinase
VLIIASSGVRAAKTGNARARYNRASSLATEALETWRIRSGSKAESLAAALEEAGGVEELRNTLHDRSDLIDRVEHFAVEARIVRAAGDALARGDLDALGTLVDDSQRAAEQLLGNQIPETIALARSARELGAIAASAFGAGFGGSVYALVRSSEVEGFRRRWADEYRRAFPARARNAIFFVTRAGIRATRVS